MSRISLCCVPDPRNRSVAKTYRDTGRLPDRWVGLSQWFSIKSIVFMIYCLTDNDECQGRRRHQGVLSVPKNVLPSQLSSHMLLLLLLSWMPRDLSLRNYRDDVDLQRNIRCNGISDASVKRRNLAMYYSYLRCTYVQRNIYDTFRKRCPELTARTSFNIRFFFFNLIRICLKYMYISYISSKPREKFLKEGIILFTDSCW